MSYHFKNSLNLSLPTDTSLCQTPQACGDTIYVRPFLPCPLLSKIIFQSRRPPFHPGYSRKIQNNTKLGRLHVLQNDPKMELLQSMGRHSHSQIRHLRTSKIQSSGSRKTPTRPKSMGNTSLHLTPTANPQLDFQIPSP